VVRRNLSYDNGDHGLDISKATGVSVVSNTVVGNATPGLNIEGASTGTSARDNIVVDNAVGSTRGQGDVRVDATSGSGTTLDHDLVYESDDATPLYEWNGTVYDDLARLRSVSGQESHGLAAPPGMEDLNARDLRLGADSPALDVADTTAQGWADRDLN